MEEPITAAIVQQVFQDNAAQDVDVTDDMREELMAAVYPFVRAVAEDSVPLNQQPLRHGVFPHWPHVPNPVKQALLRVFSRLTIILHREGHPKTTYRFGHASLQGTLHMFIEGMRLNADPVSDFTAMQYVLSDQPNQVI